MFLVGEVLVRQSRVQILRTQTESDMWSMSVIPVLQLWMSMSWSPCVYPNTHVHIHMRLRVKWLKQKYREDVTLSCNYFIEITSLPSSLESSMLQWESMDTCSFVILYKFLPNSLKVLPGISCLNFKKYFRFYQEK